MIKRIHLALIFGAVALINLTGCTGKTDPAKERARQDSIRIADSIAAVEKAAEEAEQARLDSIKEAESLKPTCFIKRASSITYKFRDQRDITANLKKIGFEKKYNHRTDWLDDPSHSQTENLCQEYLKETIVFSRLQDEQETKISDILYDVDWGGVVSDEFYFTLSFPNEEAKKDFIERVLKMNFVSQEGSKIIIGAGSELENLYISDVESLKINFYSYYGLIFHKYNP